MTHGDQIGGFFSRHHAGNAGCLQNISLGHRTGNNPLEGLIAHMDHGLSHGNPPGWFFFGHIHHADAALVIDVGQIGHIFLPVEGQRIKQNTRFLRSPRF